MNELWWMSSSKMTFTVTVKDGIIIETAAIGQKFIGQPLSNLEAWMRKQGNFQKAKLDEQ